MLVVIVLKARAESVDRLLFVASSVACFALVGLWASTMFPNLVVAGAGDPLAFFPTATQAASITVATAASSDLALSWMLGITCVGLPLVLVYHVIIYRTFKGRVKREDLEY